MSDENEHADGMNVTLAFQNPDPAAFRASLPTDAENYDVFCERCQRTHKHFFMTREGYDRMIAEGAAKVRDAVDAEIAEKVYAEFRKSEQR